MDTTVRQLKVNIEASKNLILKLQSDIDFMKAGLDYSNEERVNHYQDLKQRLSKETSCLLHLRSALVSVYYAKEIYDINTFYPELYV